jgi:hypothetical protein
MIALVDLEEVEWCHDTDGGDAGKVFPWKDGSPWLE